MYFVGHITGTEQFGSKDAFLLSGSLRETTMKGSEEMGIGSSGTRMFTS